MVGLDVGEVLAVAALAIQAELTDEDVAEMVQWHPSSAELLADACRALARKRTP
jgi:pyruvate/2-oxoglutarate dehydrogenase complex dihydrolipoamide dehydrogenase (E3) component